MKDVRAPFGLDGRDRRAVVDAVVRQVVAQDVTQLGIVLCPTGPLQETVDDLFRDGGLTQVFLERQRIRFRPGHAGKADIAASIISVFLIVLPTTARPSIGITDRIVAMTDVPSHAKIGGTFPCLSISKGCRFFDHEWHESTRIQECSEIHRLWAIAKRYRCEAT